MENLLEQELPDRQRRTDVAEIERPRVERAAGVSLVDEFHVITRDLFGRGGEVMVMKIGDGARPIGVDVRHVEPGDERAGEGIEEAFFRLVDFRHAQYVVDVADDGQAARGHQISGCVAGQGAVCVHVQTLDVGGRVSGSEAAAGNVEDRYEGVEVALVGGRVGECDVLGAAVGGDGSAAAWLAGRTCHAGGFEVEGEVLVVLLEDEDASCKVSRLCGL